MIKPSTAAQMMSFLARPDIVEQQHGATDCAKWLVNAPRVKRSLASIRRSERVKGKSTRAQTSIHGTASSTEILHRTMLIVMMTGAMSASA